jgi:hypothetical protein
MAKKKRKPGQIKADEYLEAADNLLADFEGSMATSRDEVAPIRLQLAAAVREAGAAALAKMQTAKVGRTRILIPTSKNAKAALGSSERIKERFSKFELKWLSKSDVKRLVTDGLTKAEAGQFFRHSQRLARNSRMFLERLGELEPSLQEEIDATLRQLEDNKLDITKLNVKSWTNMQETLMRNVNGRQTRAATGDAVQTFDINRNLFNLSLLEHPKGVAREILANSASRMAARSKKSKSNLKKQALVFVGAGPDAVSKMTPDSRTARVVFRLFTAKQLDDQFAKLNTGRQNTSSWRGLGLGHNSPEWYIPVPPEIEDEVRTEMRKRRSDFLARQRVGEESVSRSEGTR